MPVDNRDTTWRILAQVIPDQAGCSFHAYHKHSLRFDTILMVFLTCKVGLLHNVWNLRCVGFGLRVNKHRVRVTNRVRVIMGIGRGGGARNALDYESFSKKCCFFSFEWEKQISPLLAPWKKSSRRPCELNSSTWCRCGACDAEVVQD